MGSPRRAARVLLVDGQDRVLLLKWVHATAPERGAWWITPGGGLDEGETWQDGARRELFEETGLKVTGDLGEPVHERTIVTEVDGTAFAQHEVFFLVRVGSHDVDTRGWTPLELTNMVEHRWWTRDELAATTERLSPPNVLELVPC